MEKLKFYLAHCFHSRHAIRQWELDFEKRTTIDLINPFYDLDRTDRVNGDFSDDRNTWDEPDIIVHRDLAAIQKADGIIAFTGGPGRSFGTPMEIVYARMMKKVVVIVGRDDTHLHPWLRYHADYLTSNVGDINNIILHTLVCEKSYPNSHIGDKPGLSSMMCSMCGEDDFKLDQEKVYTSPKLSDAAATTPAGQALHTILGMDQEEVHTNPAVLAMEKTPKPNLDNPIKDSGQRRQFNTGAQRDRGENKGMPVLISPFALDRLARHLEYGAQKYDRRNWEKGMPVEEYVDSLLRHTLAIMRGETDEDHESAAMFNIMCVIHTREMIRRGVLPADLEYRPTYVSDK